MRRRLALLAGPLAVLALLVVGFGPASASDHRDAPSTDADPAADIVDLYAWHDSGSGALITVLTYASDATAALYDADVLYMIHVDNNSDNIADVEIEVRFGQNGAGAWGVQALNVPGAGGDIEGAVDTILTGSNESKLYAGRMDDPFFFDEQGLQDTLATGDLSFDPTRDSFAGLNVMAIAVEMPLASANPGGNPMRIWATTGRE